MVEKRALSQDKAVSGAGLKVGMASLGCAKNLVDSEVMLGLLSQSGMELTHDEADADVIVVNTCTFIEAAKEESIRTILDMARYKDAGKCRALIVAGCMGTRYKDQLMHELPEVDAVIGTNEVGRIPEIVDRVLGGDRFGEADLPIFLYDHTMPRVVTTGSHTAYLKISEGCNHPCAFCIIPSVRGRHRSRRMESIMLEARQLADEGVRELVLIAQDTTWYGKDLYGEFRLADLLKALTKVDGIDWFRLFYAYPTHLTDEIIDVVASEPKICNYIELPLQHAADSMLKAMRRKGTRRQIDELTAKLRQRIPGLTLRSSFIVGFPGETEEDFQQLLSFLAANRFDHVGIFQYSQEEGTAAGDMPGQIPEEVKERRYQEAMTLQKRISREINEGLVGQVLPAIIDGPSNESDLVLQSRAARQAPDIDGVIYIGNKWAEPGEIRKVRITEAYDYDLVGEIID